MTRQSQTHAVQFTLDEVRALRWALAIYGPPTTPDPRMIALEGARAKLVQLERRIRPREELSHGQDRGCLNDTHAVHYND